MSKETILIVDDEENIRKTLSDLMTDEGYEVVTASNGKEALDLMQEAQPALVLLDLQMPEMDGMETLRRFHELRPAMQVIIITGHGEHDEAHMTGRIGAYHFIRKPFSSDVVSLWVRRGIEEYRLRQENESLRSRIEKHYEIIGESPQMQELKRQIALAGPSNGWVLIHGESGSGKELVARAIHKASRRAEGPFVEVNCAAIPQELIESELFGHEKGSFTGASAMKRGKFELADRGTLFLDEIADMSLATQAKVLRVLEGREFQRVGGTRTLRTDVRVIAASNKDLTEEIRKGAFREDLYYRLNVIPLAVPPLRDRTGDIPLLVGHFLRSFSEEYGQRVKTAENGVLALFERYRWPGNVRELRNIIERLMIMVPGTSITARDVPPPISSASVRQAASDADTGLCPGNSSASLRDARLSFERDFISRKLRENKGNVSKTADEIGVERSNLHRKIKALKIEAP